MVTVELPQWLVHALVSIKHGWVIWLIALVAAILTTLIAAAIVEFIKRRYTVKQLKELEQRSLQKLLLVLTAVFTVLQSFIPFLHEHLAMLQSWPHVGEYAVGLYGFANLLYAVRYKKWFKSFTKWASKEAGTNKALDSLDRLPELPNRELQKPAGSSSGQSQDEFLQP